MAATPPAEDDFGFNEINSLDEDVDRSVALRESIGVSGEILSGYLHYAI